MNDRSHLTLLMEYHIIPKDSSIDEGTSLFDTLINDLIYLSAVCDASNF